MSEQTAGRRVSQDHGEVYSNFDHELDEAVAAAMQPGDTAGHAAWNFWGKVIRTETGWREEVWRHHSKVGVYEGTELRDVIETVNDEYGSD